MKITIIGAGNMGGAIAKGLSKSKWIAATDITCTAGTQTTLDKLHTFNNQIKLTLDNKEAVTEADLIILAVKPWKVAEILRDIAPMLKFDKQMLISIAAGVSFADFEHILTEVGIETSMPIFQVIPNTAIEVKNSMTFVAAHHATTNQTDLILQLFNELGTTMLVEEKQMAACMTLASCGIAFAFRYIRANVEAGIQMGIPASQAQEMVAQTMIGAACILQEKHSHPEVEIDKVTTPGGITIKGINELEHHGFTSAIINGLLACK